MNRFAITLFAVAALLPVRAAESNRDAQPVAKVLLPSKSPLVSFRIVFATGSASDPAGKEGVAALAAAMLSKGGTRQLSYDQIIEKMYPWATSFDSQTDKEMTVFAGTTHVDNLEKYYALIREMLLEPGFREEDFTRLRTEAVNFLKVSLRQSNDEELGKEHLYNIIYAGHPYGHHNLGTVTALEGMTSADVRAFYEKNYRRGNVVIGLAGGYPDGFAERVQADFAALPPGNPRGPKISAPKVAKGVRIEMIARETRSTAISMGFPIDVARGHEDWPALALVASYFGQHRSQNSYLYQRLREARGLNYGDYAYIEYFPRGMYQFQPDPNLARQQQIFQIWIRPVEPQHGHFALRAALYEYDKLIREGLTSEAFEGTREFLTKYVNALLQTQDARLGYLIDSHYYDIEPFDEFLPDALEKLTLADVNRAIRKHLKSDRMRIAIVTKDAVGLRDAILANQPSPITYNSPKPKEITDEDKVIERHRINVKPDAVKIVPVEQVFQ